MQGTLDQVPSPPIAKKQRSSMDWRPYLLVAPQTITFLFALVLPILAIFTISFWNFNGFTSIPGFTLNNYLGIFASPVYLKTYLNTFKFAFLVWLVCVLISYPVAYYLAFRIKNSKWQTIWFLICTVPFLTSNIIRMISWIPFLGRADQQSSNGVAPDEPTC